MSEPITIAAALRREKESDFAEMAARSDFLFRMEATDARIACIEARLSQFNSRCCTPTVGSHSASLSELHLAVSSVHTPSSVPGVDAISGSGMGNGHAREIASGASPVQERLEDLLVANKCDSFKFCRVPSDYYELTYEQRQALLGAASVDHLCKSIVMVKYYKTISDFMFSYVSSYPRSNTPRSGGHPLSGTWP